MSKTLKSAVIAALTVAATLASAQAPASADSLTSGCDRIGAKNIFRCQMLNGN